MKRNLTFLLILFLPRLLLGSITGLQIGVHNLPENTFRNPHIRGDFQYKKTALMVGILLPINISKNIDISYRMKFADHPIIVDENNVHSRENKLLTGSNEFLVGKCLHIKKIDILPQIGIGFLVDYYTSYWHEETTRGLFYYDLSINFLNIFNCDILGLSVNYEYVFLEEIYYNHPNQRFSVSLLIFKEDH